MAKEHPHAHQRGLDAAADARAMRDLLRKRYHVDALAARVLGDIRESLEAILLVHMGPGVDWDYLRRYLAAMEAIVDADTIWTVADQGEDPHFGGEVRR